MHLRTEVHSVKFSSISGSTSSLAGVMSAHYPRHRWTLCEGRSSCGWFQSQIQSRQCILYHSRHTSVNIQQLLYPPAHLNIFISPNLLASSLLELSTLGIPPSHIHHLTVISENCFSICTIPPLLELKNHHLSFQLQIKLFSNNYFIGFFVLVYFSKKSYWEKIFY